VVGGYSRREREIGKRNGVMRTQSDAKKATPKKRFFIFLKKVKVEAIKRIVGVGMG
jgi:hypothetical protein